jgi:hypothetical protein
MRPNVAARPEYVGAFTELVQRIAAPLQDLPKRHLPIKMFVAGGAATYFYTGARVSKDVDAVFSKRFALPDNLEVTYRDSDGGPRLLYFDRQYNDTFALLHEDAHAASVPLALKQVDAGILDVRLLSALDLAVSKISRLASPDRDDIAALAKQGLIKSEGLRVRAEQALKNYVGNLDSLKGAIDAACRIVRDFEPRDRGSDSI